MRSHRHYIIPYLWHVYVLRLRVFVSASRFSGARSSHKLELRFNIPYTMGYAQNAEYNNEKKNNNNEDYNNTPDAEQKSRRLKH